MDFSLHKDKIISFEGNYKYTNKIINVIQKNQTEIKQSEFVKNKLGIFQIENFEKKFTLSGSYIVNSLDELGYSKKFFKEKKGAILKKEILKKQKFIYEDQGILLHLTHIIQ